jgi:hydroxymethylbilane synthase
MGKKLRIGTRESQLAVWQATTVQGMLAEKGIDSELVLIKSEGDIDLKTPLYAMGVQGVFTRSLDIALLNGKIDIAVHSMKDVPTQLPAGIIQSAVLKRGPVKDLLVFKGNWHMSDGQWVKTDGSAMHIATSSVRRTSQWLNKYPSTSIHNLRGNVNTRLRKLAEENWDGAIFAAAGLERIGLRPENSIELDWMLPAPAQGAIMVVCGADDQYAFDACQLLNDELTAQCTKVERDFLRTLMGGCSTPISAHATITGNNMHFQGEILSLDGAQKAAIDQQITLEQVENWGKVAAELILAQGGQAIVDAINHAGN